MVNKNNLVIKPLEEETGEVLTSEKMTPSGEEEVMFDLAKGNLWFLLILQELQEKEHKCSSGKEILETLRNF